MRVEIPLARQRTLKKLLAAHAAHLQSLSTATGATEGERLVIDGSKSRELRELLRGANLRDADLRFAVIENCDLTGVDLTGARLDGAQLRYCEVRDAQLKGVSGKDLTLDGSTLVDVDLGPATTLPTVDANGKRLGVLRRLSAPHGQLPSDLTGAKLRGVVMEGTALHGAVLHGADLTGSVLRRCTLDAADASDAILGSVRAHRTSFDGVRLHGATGAGVHVDDCSFRGAEGHDGLDLQGTWTNDAGAMAPERTTRASSSLIDVIHAHVEFRSAQEQLRAMWQEAVHAYPALGSAPPPELSAATTLLPAALRDKSTGFLEEIALQGTVLSSRDMSADDFTQECLLAAAAQRVAQQPQYQGAFQQARERAAARLRFTDRDQAGPTSPRTLDILDCLTEPDEGRTPYGRDLPPPSGASIKERFVQEMDQYLEMEVLGKRRPSWRPRSPQIDEMRYNATSPLSLMALAHKVSELGLRQQDILDAVQQHGPAPETLRATSANVDLAIDAAAQHLRSAATIVTPHAEDSTRDALRHLEHEAVQRPFLPAHLRPDLPNLRATGPIPADIAGYVLSSVDLTRSQFPSGTSLVGAHLDFADLRQTRIRFADLRRARIAGADLEGAELSQADARDIDAREATFTGADLRCLNARGADLRGADLRGARLYGADLRGADLRGARLHGADLTGALLRGARLDPDALEVAVVSPAQRTMLDGAAPSEVDSPSRSGSSRGAQRPRAVRRRTVGDPRELGVSAAKAETDTASGKIGSARKLPRPNGTNDLRF